MGDHRIGKQRQSHRVALLQGQVGQGRRQRRCVLQFAAAGVGALHRSAHVQEQVQIHVRLGVVLLDVETLLPSEHFPVHVPQIVARDVLAMRRELDAETHVRAAVQAVQETLDHRPGPQLDTLQPGEKRRIDQFAGEAFPSPVSSR